MYTVREVDYPEWQVHFKNCQRANMLQHWQYAVAKERAEKLKAVRFLVADERGRVVALAQFLAKTIPFLGGVARMNRGPLLVGQIDRENCVKVVSDVMAALLGESRKRRWWLIQVAPELQKSDAAEQSLRDLGLRQLAIEPCASGLFSLLPSEETLLAGLKAKWRNCLRKGLRLGVSVINSEENSSDLNLLIKRYQQLQEDKGFPGIPEALVLALAHQNCEDWQFTLFFATEEREVDIESSIGVLVTIRHGDTSTYFIGSTDDKGRKFQANYVLLWQAILHAKRSGCQWFDLGGLNKTTPKGVAHFKEGLNAELYSLVGEWRGLNFPWRTTDKFR